MKHFSNFFYAIATLALVFASCSDNNDDGSKENIIDPVIVAPKKVVVISDIHLCDQRAKEGQWGWQVENQDKLVEFLEWVAQNPKIYSTLVVAGDMFDEWVAPMDVHPFVDVNGNETGNPSDFFEVLVRDNQPVFDAFKAAKQAGVELVYVPGNHDMTCSESDFNKYLPGLFTQARDAEGLGAYTPKGMDDVIIEHGHRYDFNDMPNPISTPGGLLPIGYTVSKYASTLAWNRRQGIYGEEDSNLYEHIDEILADPDTEQLFKEKVNQANGQAPLTYEQFCDIVHRMAAMNAELDKLYGSDNPEKEFQFENSIADDFNEFVYNCAWLAVMIAKPCSCIGELMDIMFATPIRFYPPYQPNYYLCDIVPFMTDNPALYVGLYPEAVWTKLQNINKIKVQLAFLASVLSGGVDPVLDSMASLEYFNNQESDKRIVVFGHTHKAMVRQELGILGNCLYANSGTWVDRQWLDEEYPTMTYLEIERPDDDSYTVSLWQWGQNIPISQQSLSVK